jgi:threonine synthase
VGVVDAEDPVWTAGLRTLAFELADSADGPPPDLVVIASATGVEGRALAAGFRAWHRAGLAAREPAVLVVGHGATSTSDGLVVDARDAGAARRLLAEEEGIAASPASAAALAGVVRLARAGEIAPDARVVVVLADERPSGAEGLDDAPRLVGRVLCAVPPADLARVLARPAF